MLHTLIGFPLAASILLIMPPAGHTCSQRNIQNFFPRTWRPAHRGPLGKRDYVSASNSASLGGVVACLACCLAGAAG